MSKKIRKQNQAGFALLLELMVVCLVTTTLMCMAVPGFMRVRSSEQEVQARQQMRTVSNANAAIAICQQTTGCVVNPGVSSLVPAAPSITQGGYTFVYTTGSCWNYIATPVSDELGQRSYYVDCTGVLRFGTNPGPTSPIWSW
jgi:type II secretory pathway pseudopilin PulG